MDRPVGLQTAAGRRLKLRLEGVEMNGGGNVRIFVNLPNADNRSSSDLPNYVGYFAQVPSSLGGHSHRPLNISIDVTDKLPALQRAGAALTVTLVPLNRPSGPPRLGSARIVVE